MSAEALAQAEASAKVGGSQDILTITSFDQQDLTGKYPVDSDGTFTFPPIGRVKAGGLTLRQLEAELKRLLMDGFFKDPQLSVGVETYKSQTIHIVGEVCNPGTYPLTGEMSLIEAVAAPGPLFPVRPGRRWWFAPRPAPGLATGQIARRCQTARART